MTIYQVGRHMFRHGSIDGDLTPLLENKRILLYYSDPPWGDGNLKYWDTMNIKMNENAGRQEQVLTHSQLLDRIFGLLRDHLHEQGVAFIEYGRRWKAAFPEYCERYNLLYAGGYEGKYKDGSKLQPLDVHVMAKRQTTLDLLPPTYAASLLNEHSYARLTAATKPFVAHIAEQRVDDCVLMDACCGEGYRALLALDFNLPFRGNELNLARMTKAMKRVTGK